MDIMLVCQFTKIVHLFLFGAIDWFGWYCNDRCVERDPCKTEAGNVRASLTTNSHLIEINGIFCNSPSL